MHEKDFLPIRDRVSLHRVDLPHVVAAFGIDSEFRCFYLLIYFTYVVVVVVLNEKGVVD